MYVFSRLGPRKRMVGTWRRRRVSHWCSRKVFMYLSLHTVYVHVDTRTICPIYLPTYAPGVLIWPCQKYTTCATSAHNRNPLTSPTDEGRVQSSNRPFSTTQAASLSVGATLPRSMPTFFSLLLFSPHFSIGAVACMHASNAPFHDGTRGPRRYVERRPAIDRWDYRVSCCNQWCATSCHALGPELSWLRGRGEGTETDQGSSTPLGIARLLRECPMFPAVR